MKNFVATAISNISKSQESKNILQLKIVKLWESFDRGIQSQSLSDTEACLILNQIESLQQEIKNQCEQNYLDIFK